jgi:hypothetical protein
VTNTAAANVVISEQGVLLQDRTVGGVELKAGMTPRERFQALARSMETGTYAPQHNGAGPPLEYQTHGTQTRIAQGEKRAAPNTVGNKPAPPSPKELERQQFFENKPPQGEPSAARQAELDAELQAKGLLKRPDGTTHADGQPDLEAAERLTARYRKLCEALLPNDMPPQRREAKHQELREVYERDMVRILNGRPLTELELSIDMPKPKAPAAPAPTAPVARNGWQSHIEDGQWVGLENITTADTHGYTIPRYVKEQRLHVSTFELFKQAKAAGISQAQVNAVMHQQAVNMGWVKN